MRRSNDIFLFPVKYRVFDRLKFEKLTPEEKEQYYSDLEKYASAINCLETAEKRGEIRGREEGIQIGMEKGMEKGLEKGRVEERRNTVKILKDLGLGIDIIASKVGITKEEAQLYLKD